MRKTLIIAFGLTGVSALAAMQPAFAEKKHVCQTQSTLIGRVTGQKLYSRQFAAACLDRNGKWNAAKAAANHCTSSYPAHLGATGTELTQCFDIDVPPTPKVAVPGNRGNTKSFSPSTNMKNK